MQKFWEVSLNLLINLQIIRENQRDEILNNLNDLDTNSETNHFT